MIRHTLAALLIALPGVLILESGTEAASTIHACKYEDGSGQARCVWDARHMGNGEGRSLIIRKGGTDDMSVRVITHKRAHRLAGL